MSETFPQLFRKHRKAVFGVAYRMLGDVNDAEDVTQETFERLFADPPQDLERTVEPWLVRVAVNLARDRLRSRSREVRGTWLPSPVPTDELVSEDDPERRLRELQSIRFAFLHAAERLTPAQRAVFVLRQVFEYSVAETAEVLDLSSSAVKTNLHRARNTLGEMDGPRRDVDDETIVAFLQHLAARDHDAVRDLLHQEIRTFADGGEHFFAARPMQGHEEVLRLLEGLSQKYRGLEFEVARINGEIAIIGHADTVPAGWTRHFALVPEVRDGKVVSIRNVLDPGKLGRVVMANHALFIGCTGMLAHAVQAIAPGASRSVAISRKVERAKVLSVDVGIEANWTNADGFLEALNAQCSTHGRFDLAVVWMHGDGAGVWTRLHEVLAPGARVFEVLGSARVASLAELEDHREAVRAANHRRIVLGRERSRDGSWRWLTDDEISRGVASLVLRDRSGIVGEI